ncbi:hypothetical protein DVH24_008172 [Malus domestica]|uniref:Uncharacterized protein n=1 Tax=Malus domestica TaxID=3750 RepID=A0A498JQ10_MALDO|nr:hypothetical protein DVH24_008172 [Malus domestica]
MTTAPIGNSPSRLCQFGVTSIFMCMHLILTWIQAQISEKRAVPLKTYLPDGDIDLIAFGVVNVEEALANDICTVLEREYQNMAAEFMVKLVKCLVQNIGVDISFTQFGGLCTLCFHVQSFTQS